MLFNSFGFLVFFPLVCLLYFLLPSRKAKNTMLLIASYYFYMSWKPIYALLILCTTLITFLCSLLVEQNNGNKKRKKLFFVCSLIINFGILFVFKYYNFINESIFSLMSSCGWNWRVRNLDILLPVGISFYTFQAVGYSIDVYRGTLKAEKNFFTYALFVSFFPQLVAGPIERAKNLLPQFYKANAFSYKNATEGIRLMVWGYFMKLCIADRISEYVNAIYNNVPNHNGASLLLATFFFTFQIYCDFAGYSNIAIGAAKFMGYDLMENFHRPYLSLNVKDFWKRWHISLSSWFMDYLYIPLGGNRVSYPRHLLNLLITFLVSGAWHGANWTFVLWGFTHGVFIIIDNIIRKYIGQPKTKTLFSKVVSIAVCFCLVAFAWIFFRANSASDAFLIINKIFTQRGTLFTGSKTVLILSFVSLFILFAKSIKDEAGIKINFLHSKSTLVSYLSTVLLISYILLFGALEGNQFIYFQF